jgi:diguanylate cyclase
MAQNDDPENQSAVWKRKYYDALGEHESKERSWTQADEVLRKTISRLSLAADGLDNTLDGQLKDLRDAIRDRADARALRQRIDAMSESLVRLDAKRTKKTIAPNPAAPLQALLDKLTLPNDKTRRIKALRKQLDNASDEKLALVIADFAKLLQDILAEFTAASEAGGDKSSGGFLSRLFGSKDASTDQEKGAPAKAAPEKATTVPAAAPSIASRRGEESVSAPVDTAAISLGAARDLLLHVLEQFQALEPARIGELRKQAVRAATEAELKRLAKALAEGFKTPLPSAESPAPISQVDADATEEDPACGSQMLLQLLQRLDLPSDLDAQVDALKDKLSDPDNFDAQIVLSDMATLIADMRVRLQEEKHEIEDFLKQLTGQLQDIDSYVRGADTARADAYESGRELGDVVQAQVRGINDSVATAQNLDGLKRSVQQRLKAISDHVEQHRVKEELRNMQTEAQMRDMTERLRDMEGESAKLRERIQEQRTQAFTDALTGIPNRLAYQERIVQEYARWKRFNTPLVLLVWDVDHFKAVNDKYGHKAGDKVLKVIAETLNGKIRETDFLARYGGEEFVLVMTGTRQPVILDVANKLRQAIETCGFHFRGEDVSITISCGIAEFQEGDAIDAVFERADAALYRAKDQGRNCCVIAESEQFKQ